MESGYFRSKPVVVQAWRFDGTEECARQILEAAGIDGKYKAAYLSNLHVLEFYEYPRCWRAAAGDWIVKRAVGRTEVLDAAGMEQSYEPAEGTSEDSVWVKRQADARKVEAEEQAKELLDARERRARREKAR